MTCCSVRYVGQYVATALHIVRGERHSRFSYFRPSALLWRGMFEPRGCVDVVVNGGI